MTTCCFKALTSMRAAGANIREVLPHTSTTRAARAQSHAHDSCGLTQAVAHAHNDAAQVRYYAGCAATDMLVKFGFAVRGFSPVKTGAAGSRKPCGACFGVVRLGLAGAANALSEATDVLAIALSACDVTREAHQCEEQRLAQFVRLNAGGTRRAMRVVAATRRAGRVAA